VVTEARQRIDKWLWAARFFKTRSLAAAAIDAGRVRIDAHAVKPAREIRLGEAIEIHVGTAVWRITVAGLNDQRRPAPEARLLYVESDASRQQREHDAELRRLAPMPGADLRGRPTKKARRLIGRILP
jgi:ribosome-associated heat shock protein Hsp15